MRPNAERPGVIDKEQDQAIADAALLLACSVQALESVSVSLRGGASINATLDDGTTGVSLACKRADWEHALLIVKLLLAERFAPSQPDNEGRNALHWASWCSSGQIVATLLQKMQKLVNVLTNDRCSSLTICCRRSDDEAEKVALMLLDAGADVESVDGDQSRTPLLIASRHAHAKLVALLLQSGANVKAVDKDGRNALHLACCNGAFGGEIIPLLVKAGADVLQLDKDGHDAMVTALAVSGERANILCKFLSSNYKLEKRCIASADPIGSMVVGAKFGMTVVDHDFAVWVAVNRPFERCWAGSRNGLPLCFDQSETDVFNALAKSNNVELWIACSYEPGFQQHPKTGDTVLHLLCRTDSLRLEDKMVVLTTLKRDFRNPLIPNFRNQLASDLTSDPILRSELNTYMKFKANKHVMKWFGPLFRKRVFAFLLVLKRLQSDMCKDVRLLLIKYMSKVEYIYVPSVL